MLWSTQLFLVQNLKKMIIVNSKLNRERDSMPSLFVGSIFALLPGNRLEWNLTPGRSWRHAAVFGIVRDSKNC